MTRNRITGHTFNRKVNGDIFGTIRVKWNGKTKVVKWDKCSPYDWNQWGADSDVLSFTTAYLEEIIHHFE